ncbi:tetratricopeptide repeat-containing S1 family peptidase [Geminocystis herdmanii]|uniref:tetratricopeptide repeat-containing S1 family peptidase n=1 Tax=Geminocystis herdmanii TaxID=669359 RepID=UPI0003466EF4|nr:tetratricopeptide repeat-containing serine protease family protein [Geminocystis herdmanii]
MINNYISGLLFATCSIVLIQPQLVQAQNVAEIDKIAQQVTVKIETSGEPGSGVIIANYQDKYYVLTARHVVNKVKQGEFFKLRTYDKKEHELDITKVQYLPNNLDLALVEFRSKNSYPVVKISTFNYAMYQTRDYTNKLFTENSDKHYVFVSGWPILKDEEKRIFATGYLFDNSGSAISSPPDPSQDDFLGGYELIYTNLTHPGMSGGPVLDTKGRLIGIHGRADGREIGDEDEIIKNYLNEVGVPVRIKIGLSWGIPINTFMNWASTQSINSLLTVEQQAPPVMSETTVSDWSPHTPLDKKNPYYWLERGNQLWRIGKVSEARGAFQQAINLKEDLYLAWFAKGFASGFDRKFDIALESCEKAITLQVNPSIYKYEAYRCKAGALLELKDFQGALDSLNEALKLNTHNPADWMTQGELYYALGNLKEATSSIDKAVKLRDEQGLPPSALIYNNRAFIWIERQEYELANKDIEQALKIDPKYVPAWVNKGMLLEATDRDEEALNAYNQALTMAEDDYNIWTNKAFVEFKMELYINAKKSLETALTLKPDYQPAINSLKVVEEKISDLNRGR